MNPYEFMFPRLEGAELEKDPSPFIRLVEKGVSGFILFGGRLDAVRAGIEELRGRARLPLIIASDLERGLGQQVEGGTVLPSAMAFGSASEGGMGDEVLGRAFSFLAAEARWAGINMVLAPVLDINSNPENPIIATRAFGELPETVSRLGVLMAERFARQGVYACGKHFPGHGDTYQDSHLELPAIEKTFGELEKFELKPFRAAIKAGVPAIMTGHLRLPLEDPSGLPATLSRRALDYLRSGMGFEGLIITDALNMAGAGGQQGLDEGQRAEMALLAGANVLLHPSRPEETAGHLLECLSAGRTAPWASGIGLLREKRSALAGGQLRAPSLPDFEGNRGLAHEIALRAIRAAGISTALRLDTANLLVVVLTDDPRRLGPFVRELEDRAPSVKFFINPGMGFTGKPSGEDALLKEMARGGRLLAVAHSTPEAWKPPSPGLRRNIRRFSAMGPVWLSFGNPYVIAGERRKILTYSDNPELQREMAERVAAGRFF
ncbi:MAG: hypothetical protein M0Z58_05765 [Nitrospiraceae bacterium]|nr:hypothetical protein [Nitrospiraceae bacterium]